MGSLHMTTGAAVPFFVNDFHVIDIQPDAFDPITTLHDDDYVHPTEMSEPHMIGLYERKGFLVRPNADGDIWLVTKARYDAACNRGMTIAQRRAVLADLDPKKFDGKEGQWIETPVVKVFGTDGDGAGHYTATATEIRVGIIL